MDKEVQTISNELSKKTSANDVTLADLMELAKPLLKNWTESENEIHRREFEYQNNLLQIKSKQNRIITIGIFIISGMLFTIVGILFYFGRDSSAMDLIKLIIGLVGAAFGGYGWAQTRFRDQEEL